MWYLLERSKGCRCLNYRILFSTLYISIWLLSFLYFLDHFSLVFKDFLHVILYKLYTLSWTSCKAYTVYSFFFYLRPMGLCHKLWFFKWMDFYKPPCLKVQPKIIAQYLSTNLFALCWSVFSFSMLCVYTVVCFFMRHLWALCVLVCASVRSPIFPASG